MVGCFLPSFVLIRLSLFYTALIGQDPARVCMTSKWHPYPGKGKEETRTGRQAHTSWREATKTRKRCPWDMI